MLKGLLRSEIVLPPEKHDSLEDKVSYILGWPSSSPVRLFRELETLRKELHFDEQHSKKTEMFNEIRIEASYHIGKL